MIHQLDRTEDEIPVVHKYAHLEEAQAQPVTHGMTRDRKRILLVAGGFGILSAALLAAAPELGIASALASVVAGSASAATTILAKR